ncbi:MAG: head-tail adaptor protein [Pseudomonadota bacterium]
MNAPALTRRLTLEAPTRTSDAAGGYVETWANLGYVWGHIDTLGAGSDASLEGPTSAVRIRITLRAAPVGSSRRPKPEQRLRDGSRIFDIDAVTEADHPLYLWVWVREETLQ